MSASSLFYWLFYLTDFLLLGLFVMGDDEDDDESWMFLFDKRKNCINILEIRSKMTYETDN